MASPRLVSMQVAIEVPRIKATLSDAEYELLTSIAGDNFKEDQLIPASALWLEDRHLEKRNVPEK